MKTRTVKRHYCDFCRKAGFYRAKMEKHERGCTANKNRVCGMCNGAGGDGQVPLVDLLAILNPITEENKVETFAALKYAAHNCPACILAALRHHGKTSITLADPSDRSTIIGVEFDFKESAKAWWEERNNDRIRDLAYDQ